MKRSVLAIGMSVVLGVTSLVAGNPLPAQATGSCADYLFVGARGTGGAPQGNGLTPSSYTNAPAEGMSQFVFDTFDGLRTAAAASGKVVEGVALYYPASSPGLMPGSSVWSPFKNVYNYSAGLGAQALETLIEAKTLACPDTRFILAGYSQGADALSRGLDLLDPADKELIAATVLFGDPKFNPTDSMANFGGFDPTRGGLGGQRTQKWDQRIDSPVFSYCHYGDVICQASVRFNVGGQPGWYWDLNSIQQIMNREYLGNPFGAHENYDSAGDVASAIERVSFDLSLSLSTECSEPLDVVFLIDDSNAMEDQLNSIRDSAWDITEAVRDRTSNARMGIVTFAGWGTGSSGLSNVSQSLTTSQMDVFNAFQGLNHGGGSFLPGTSTPIATAYSGLVETGSINWRSNARKIVIVASASALNGNSEMGPEVTSIERGTVRANLTSIRSRLNADVIIATDDLDVGTWQEDIAGMTGGTVVRVEDPDYVGANMIEFIQDAVLIPEAHITGPVRTTVGTATPFSIASLRPFIPCDGGIYWGAPPQSKTSGPQSYSSIDPLTWSTFDEPGIYTVEATVTTPSGDVRYETEVEVAAAPENLPPAPLVTSSIDGSEVTIRWNRDVTNQSEYYAIRTISGDLLEAFSSDSGGEEFNYVYSGTSPNPALPIEVYAGNSLGETKAIPMVSAEEADYEQRSMILGEVAGQVLTLSGDSSPIFDQLRAGLGGPLSFDLSGDYGAKFVPNSGAPMLIDMTNIDADLTFDGSDWTAEFHFGDEVDQNGRFAWQRMSGDFLVDLFDGANILLEAGGSPLALRIDGETSVVETAPNAQTPPASGVELDYYGGSWYDQTIFGGHNFAYDESLFPAASGQANPREYDWSAEPITDIHLFINGAEIPTNASVSLYTVHESTTTDEASIQFEIFGPIGDGTLETYRDFLRYGMVTFRVGSGPINKVKFLASTQDTLDIFPPTGLPDFNEVPQPYVGQYRQVLWSPKYFVGWNAGHVGTLSISPVGLPDGVSVVNGGETLTGIPTFQGRYDFDVTAADDSGSATHTFTLTVGPSYADDVWRLDPTSIARQSDGTLKLRLNRPDFFSVDNRNVTRNLPAFTEANMSSHTTETFTPFDLHFYDTSGDEIAVSGDFEIEIDHDVNTGYIQVRSDNAVVESNSTADANEFWSSDIRITFKRGATGAQNTIWKSRNLVYVLP